MNEIDWVSVLTRGLVGVIFGPPVTWGLWCGFSAIAEYFHPTRGEGAVIALFGFVGGTFGAIVTGMILGPILLISWGIWGESLLAILSSHLSTQRPKRKR